MVDTHKLTTSQRKKILKKALDILAQLSTLFSGT